MFGSNPFASMYFAQGYALEESGPVFMRRPNMMRVGSRGDWIFKTVNGLVVLLGGALWVTL